MPEERPRPKYGEYATPQDQARSIANSLPPVSPLLAPHDRPVDGGAAVPVPVRDEAGTASASVPAAPAPVSSVARPSVPASPPGVPVAPPGVGSGVAAGDKAPARDGTRRSRRWDVILSVALLVYGFVVTVSGLVQPIDVAAALDEVYRLQGVGDFTSVELAQSIGLGITFSNVVIFALTLVVTVRSLNARRISFYWPLIGGVVAAIIGAVLLFIVIVNDPAFSAYVEAGR